MCLTVMRTENCTSASRFDHVYIPNCCHVIGWLYICVREQLDSRFCKAAGQCKFSQSDTSGEARLLCVASPHTCFHLARANSSSFHLFGPSFMHPANKLLELQMCESHQHTTTSLTLTELV